MLMKAVMRARFRLRENWESWVIRFNVDYTFALVER